MIRIWLASAAAITLAAGFAAAQTVQTETSSKSYESSSSTNETHASRKGPTESYEWSKETDTVTHSAPPAPPPQVTQRSTTTTTAPPAPLMEETHRKTTTTTTGDQ